MDARAQRLLELRRAHRQLLRGVPDNIVEPIAAGIATAVQTMPVRAERNVAELELRRYLDDVLLGQPIDIELPDRFPSVGPLRAVNEGAKLSHLLSAGWRLAERTVGLGHVLPALGETCEGTSGEIAIAAEELRTAVADRCAEASADGDAIPARAWYLAEVRSFVIAALVADRLADDGYVDSRDPRSTDDPPAAGAYL